MKILIALLITFSSAHARVVKPAEDGGDALDVVTIADLPFEYRVSDFSWSQAIQGNGDLLGQKYFDLQYTSRPAMPPELKALIWVDATFKCTELGKIEAAARTTVFPTALRQPLVAELEDRNEDLREDGTFFTAIRCLVQLRVSPHAN